MIVRLTVWAVLVTLVASATSDAEAQTRRTGRRGNAKPAPVQKIAEPEPEAPIDPDTPPLEYAKEEGIRGGFLPRWFRLIRIDGSTEGGYTYNTNQPGNSRPLKRPPGFQDYPDHPTSQAAPPPPPPPPPPETPIENPETPCNTCCQLGIPEDECGEGFGENRPPKPVITPTPENPTTPNPEQPVVVEESKKKRNWKKIRDGRIRSGQNPYRVFDNRHDGVTLNVVRLNIRKETAEDSPWGFSFKFLGGTDSEVVSGEGEQSITRVEAQEAMGSFRLPGTRNTKIHAGRMPSAVGAEVIEARDNYNQSRGLLFGLLQPMTVEGGRVETPLTEKISFSGGMLRGWDQSIEGEEDGGGTGEAKITYKPSERTTISGAAMSGQTSDEVGGGQRTLLDLVARHRFSDTSEGYINANFLTEDGGEDIPGGEAAGISAGFRKQFGDRLRVATRLEILDDQGGSRTGFKQTMGSATATVDYRIGKRTLARFEVRHDTSTDSAFVSGTRPISNQNTIAANILWDF